MPFPELEEDEPEDEEEEPEPEEEEEPEDEEEEPEPEEDDEPEPEDEEDPELDEEEEPSQSHSGMRSCTLYFICTHHSGSPFSSVHVIFEEMRPFTSAGKIECDVSLWMPAGIGQAVCEQRSSTSGESGM